MPVHQLIVTFLFIKISEVVMSTSLKFTVLEDRIVFDAALAAVIADVKSSHTAGDAHLIADIQNIQSNFGATSPIHVIYVDQNVNTAAPGYTPNGSSWSNAYTTVQSALANAATWDSTANPAHSGQQGESEILIAQGNYSNTASFTVPDGVVIFGGFATGGVASGMVDALGRPIGSNGALLDTTTFSNGGVSNIISMSGTGSTPATETTVIIDGLTISNGNGAASSNAATISALSNSDLLLFNDSFINNSAPDNNNGGAIDVENSNLTVFDSLFSGNTAINGGAIYTIGNNQVTIVNDSLQSDNVAQLGKWRCHLFTGGRQCYDQR